MYINWLALTASNITDNETLNDCYKYWVKYAADNFAVAKFSGVGFFALILLHGNLNILVYMYFTEEYGEPFLRESHVLG